MRAALLAAALAATGLLCGCGSGGGALLLSSSGTGPDQTYTFDPQGPWSVDYRWDCTGAALRNPSLQRAFSWDMLNGDDDTLVAQNPHVLVKGMKGSGTLAYAMGGAYYMKVTSGCDWVVQVKETKR